MAGTYFPKDIEKLFPRLRQYEFPSVSMLNGGEILYDLDEQQYKYFSAKTMQFEPMGGGSTPPAPSTYTNTDPTTATVGGIPAGSTFTEVALTAMWDQLLYPYQPPAFTNFYIAGAANVVESGAFLRGGSTPNNTNCSFRWVTTNGSNVSPNTVDISCTTTGTDIILNTADDGEETVTFSDPQRTTPGSVQYRISAQNTHGTTFNRTRNYSWQWRFWGGSSSNTSLNETEIKALPTTGLRSGYAGTYALSNIGYKFIAFPNSWGTPSSFSDHDTGFSVAMEAPISISISNAYGIASMYNVYRTTNFINSALNLTVA